MVYRWRRAQARFHRDELGGGCYRIALRSYSLGGPGWPSSAYLGRNATRSLLLFFSELLQESQFVFVEVTYVIDSVPHHAETGDP